MVVSGKAKDHNNFLDEEVFKSGQSVAGVKCHVFGNWDEAVRYIKSHLKKEGKLLIVQGAHGTNQATYLVNKGDPVSTQTILKGFQNSALLKPQLNDEKDIKRRKACRDFKF